MPSTSSRRLPLVCAGVIVGSIAARHRDVVRDAARQCGIDFSDLSDVSDVDGDTLALHLAPEPARANADIEALCLNLRDRGLIEGWRNERFAVRSDFDQPALFDIERAAVRFFGMRSWSAHLNATVGTHMWIARRSPDKPIDPGMLDNLVGGGIAAGMTALDTLVKEAWEEAGIAAPLARQARPRGQVHSLRAVPQGWQDEVIFVYDLELPGDFLPVNHDGEVAGFQCLPLAGIVRMMQRDDVFTYEARLVIRAFLEGLGSDQGSGRREHHPDRSS